MSVGRRLMLALLPAIFGLAAAVALAYYGEYQRQAPEWFVVVALVSALASLVIAWRVTRQVAQRIERLADWRTARGGSLQRAAGALRDSGITVAPPSRGLDELDTIEGIVEHLTTSHESMRSERDRVVTLSDAQRREYAELVRHTADTLVQRLEEVRLPLHILLENRFGELNENQEEMLGTARVAAELADEATLRLRDMAEFDLGTMHLRADTVRLADLLATITPGLSVEAQQRDVQLQESLAPALPSFTGDREQLQVALGQVLRDAVQRTPSGGTLTVNAEATAGELRLVVAGAAGSPSVVDRALPRRILRAHGGRIDDTADGVRIVLPLPSAP
jgi:signal transduction histidine kinase